jgi:hypothetical protein
MNLGDKQAGLAGGCSEEEMRENIDGILAILPLYLYQHSGLTIQTTPFSCRWDSGQVGWAYVTDTCAKEMGCVGDRREYDKESQEIRKSRVVGTWDQEALEEAIRGEVSVYDDYLNGRCYGYEVVGLEDTVLESCWGFIEDLDYVRLEAREAAEHSVDPIEQEQAALLPGRITCGAGEGAWR